MKRLITTKLKYDILTIVLVVFIGGIIFYFSIRRILEKNVREVLEIRKEYAINLINRTDDKDLIKEDFADVYHFYLEKNGAENEPQIIKDTLIYDKAENEHLLFRELSFTHCKTNNCFRVSVRTALVDHHIILETVLLDILFICFMIAATLVVSSFFISKKIWEPFYITLNNFSRFNLDESKKFEANETTIWEFKELNNTLLEISKRIHKQYGDLKEVTSYLTHELQTPLAVVRAHADLLLQSENVTEEQLKSISTIKNTIERMSQMEDSLILIKRIELGEFDQQQATNFKQVFQEKINQMDELIRLEEISYTIELKDELLLNIHNQLLDTLLNNIISNAIRHNYEGGYIHFSLDTRKVVIKNSFRNKTGTDNLTEKNTLTTKGLGIGLSIVKAICKKYNYTLSIDNNNSEFCLAIDFN